MYLIILQFYSTICRFRAFIQINFYLLFIYSIAITHLTKAEKGGLGIIKLETNKY